MEKLAEVANRQPLVGYERLGNGTSQVNVGGTERWTSLIAGGLVTFYGLSRGSLSGLGLALGGGYLMYRGLTGYCSAYEAMGVNMAEREEGQGITIEKTVTVNRPVAEVYRFWHNFDNLPHFMEHLTWARTTGPGQSHWVAKAPGGMTFEWDAAMIEDRENELIAWRSLPGADVDNRGSVQFKEAPGGRGTEVKVKMEYYPPGGVAGVAFAKVFNGVMAQQIKEDMRRFKQVLETGEIATTAGQPSGREGEIEAEQSHQKPLHTIKQGDLVDEASWASFPASDPPAVW